MRRLAIALLVANLAGTAAAGDVAETARFLAGKGEHARADYAAQINAGWNQFEQPNLEHMRTWWKDHAPTKYSTVFYPFSGPDIANALALFPDADTYLMFGLEAPGAIPDFQAMDDDSLTTSLDELETTLSTVLQVNYFFTKTMEKKLGNGSFNNVSGLLLFFLAMSDCDVTSAKLVTLGAIPGVEIAFTRNGGKQQTIRYYAVNVADASLPKNFVTYLEHQGRFVTMIKAASYLMHKESIAEPMHFTKIRALILEHSDFVVQDDSGIPLRLFARDSWKLRFHGRYEAPTAEFAKYLQKDLRVETQRNSTGRLPFSYGYAYKQGEANLMTAQREEFR